MKKVENIGDYATDPRYATSRLWDKRGVAASNIATLNQIIETIGKHTNLPEGCPSPDELLLDDAVNTMHFEAAEFLRICKQIKEATG